jgi:hypothetical protein
MSNKEKMLSKSGVSHDPAAMTAGNGGRTDESDETERATGTQVPVDVVPPAPVVSVPSPSARTEFARTRRVPADAPTAPANPRNTVRRDFPRANVRAIPSKRRESID